jgi:N-acetylglutamate synthase-like GNAT family acetyltransferase
VAGDLQGRGLGRQVVEGLLSDPRLQRVERVYLMTTNSAGFYAQLGFQRVESQQLLAHHPLETSPSQRVGPGPEQV